MSGPTDLSPRRGRAAGHDCKGVGCVPVTFWTNGGGGLAGTLQFARHMDPPEPGAGDTWAEWAWIEHADPVVYLDPAFVNSAAGGQHLPWATVHTKPRAAFSHVPPLLRIGGRNRTVIYRLSIWPRHDMAGWRGEWPD